MSLRRPVRVAATRFVSEVRRRFPVGLSQRWEGIQAAPLASGMEFCPSSSLRFRFRSRLEGLTGSCGRFGLSQ